jgi:hypothetical protein
MANGPGSVATRDLKQQAQFLLESAQRVDVCAKLIGINRANDGGKAVRILTSEPLVDAVVLQLSSDAKLLSIDSASDVLSEGVEVTVRIGETSEWRNAGKRASRMFVVRTVNVVTLLMLSLGIWVQMALCSWAEPVRTPLFAHVFNTTGVDLWDLTQKLLMFGQNFTNVSSA